MLNVFVYFATIIFWVLFFIWHPRGYDLLVKVVLGGMGVFGLVVAAHLSGYIVKIS